METRSLALHHMASDEIAEVLQRDPRLLVPVGALDQHGPHLPLGANTMIAKRVANDLSRILSLLVAPPLPYGIVHPDGEAYAGTAGLRRKTFHRAVNELLASWDDHGVTELVVITAQRHEPHLEALLTALTPQASTTVVDLMMLDVSDILEGNPREERGGELETSLMLHLAVDLVRPDRIADFHPPQESLRRYLQGKVATPLPEFRGSVGYASRASAEKGRKVYERYLQILTDSFRNPQIGGDSNAPLPEPEGS
ncbi:MAG: creatininase [Gemmatimonadota bacterium]|nr:MAG: creatininase [Gemmatimonadota bacterium]